MNDEELAKTTCLMESKAEWNFIRPYYCSKPKGHQDAHRAYWHHDLEGQVAWVGPWVDGRSFEVPEEPKVPKRFEIVKSALSDRSLHLHGDTVYEPDYGGHCLGCFDDA